MKIKLKGLKWELYFNGWICRTEIGVIRVCNLPSEDNYDRCALELSPWCSDRIRFDCLKEAKDYIHNELFHRVKTALDEFPSYQYNWIEKEIRNKVFNISLVTIVGTIVFHRDLSEEPNVFQSFLPWGRDPEDLDEESPKTWVLGELKRRLLKMIEQ